MTQGIPGQAPQGPQMNEYQRKSLELLVDHSKALAAVHEASLTTNRLLERIAVATERALTLPRASATGGAPAAASAPTGGGDGRGGIASDYEMSGEHGNPVVKKDPPKWSGPSEAGRRMADCTPTFLDEIAGFYDWMGSKRLESTKTFVNAKGETVREADTAKFLFKDARRARGWAQRARSAPPARVAAPDPFATDESAFSSDDDIPFICSTDSKPRHLRRRTLWMKW